MLCCRRRVSFWAESIRHPQGTLHFFFNDVHRRARLKRGDPAVSVLSVACAVSVANSACCVPRSQSALESSNSRGPASLLRHELLKSLAWRPLFSTWEGRGPKLQTTQTPQVMVHQRDRTADIVAHVNLGKLSMIDLAGHKDTEVTERS